jgi:hypothetical protein
MKITCGFSSAVGASTNVCIKNARFSLRGYKTFIHDARFHTNNSFSSALEQILVFEAKNTIFMYIVLTASYLL